MMIHAYQEIYLSKAQAVLGEAFDYAINTCNISGDSFIKQFIVSSVSKKMENGEPTYLAGKSGIEIASDVVLETTGKELTEVPTDRLDRSTEYWIGWAIAYYQWWSGRKYSAIFKAFSIAPDPLSSLLFSSVLFSSVEAGFNASANFTSKLLLLEPAASITCLNI